MVTYLQIFVVGNIFNIYAFRKWISLDIILLVVLEP